jgi:hypothetical protein
MVEPSFAVLMDEPHPAAIKAMTATAVTAAVLP